METIAVFLVAAWIAFYATRAVTAAIDRRRQKALGTRRTQVQIGGDGSTQIQVGRNLAVTVTPIPPRGGSGQSPARTDPMCPPGCPCQRQPSADSGGYRTLHDQIVAVSDSMTRQLNNFPGYVGTGRRLPPSRNGGPFTTVTTCPTCGTYALHPMRAANPEPPDGITIRNALGETVASNADRWDETPYELVRSCADHDCGWEWGHPAAPTAVTGNARLDDAIDQIKTDPRREPEEDR